MKKKWIYLLAAWMLAVGVCVSTPMISGAAPELDKEDCSLTIYPENPLKEEKFGDELKEAKVMVDVYYVAEAVPTPGYDTYSYAFTDGYKELTDKMKKDPKAEDWRVLAQDAARLALENDLEKFVAHVPLFDEVKAPKITMMKPGLYLVIARGGDLTEPEDYVTEIEQEDGTKIIATIANSIRYQYTFEPQLISLPMRGNDDTISDDGTLHVTEEEDREYNTADTDRWVYDLTMNLKPQQLPRFGDLRIIKTLESHEVLDAPGITPPAEEGGEDTRLPEGEHFEALKDPATFVFKITVTRMDASGNEEDLSKYNKVESITFTATGEESVLIKNLPADATVKVEEVYSGSSYENTISPDGPVTIVADDVVEANFSNRYDWHRRNGYGIKNQFTYQTGEGGTPGWELVQNPQQSVEEEAGELEHPENPSSQEPEQPTP